MTLLSSWRAWSGKLTHSRPLYARLARRPTYPRLSNARGFFGNAQVRVPFYDDTITRVKADALLYDEDSFSWFHSEGIVSVNVDAARQPHRLLHSCRA